jgi:hypothetical protein
MSARASDEQINAAIELLRVHGLVVTSPDEGWWERTGDFCRRLGISGKHFSAQTRRVDCPAFRAERGRLGSIRMVRGNPQFEAFLTRHRQQPSA